MENVSTMVDSILNALWWPWSRNSNSNTNQPSLSTTLSASTSITRTIASTTTTNLVANNDLQVSTSSSLAFNSSYYIPFGSLFNPFVANETSVNTTTTNFTEFFTTVNNFISNSSLFSYSNHSTIHPSLDFSTNNNSGVDINSENLDYYYNFGENATSINHSFIFATTRNNNTNDKILLDSAADESTIYLIQIVVTAIILGIVILATVIGEYIFFYLFKIQQIFKNY